MKSNTNFRKILYSVFFFSIAVLLFELNLTRIFSVILWYHFAFMAVSLALFGLCTGGLFVYYFKNKLNQNNPTFLFYILIAAALSIIIIFFIIFNIKISLSFNLKNTFTLLSIYILLSIPFFISGIFISTIITKFNEQISKIYFFDLLGAGTGCLLIIPALSTLGPENTLILSSILFSLAAFFLALYYNKSKLPSTIILILFVILLFLNQNFNFFNIKYVKSKKETDVVYSEWNAFSRVAVYDGLKFLDWGLSTEWDGKKIPPPPLKTIDIDACAGMIMVGFDGDLSKVGYLKYSITSIGYNLRHNGNLAIIGAGSGKDVLGALSFGANKIYAIDINPILKTIVNDKFGAFTNKLYENKKINFIIQDGRSFIKRSKKLFSLIQISMVDTWAATSSGAFALAENSLYTTQAFQDYINHLEDNGILTISRFLFKPARESLRTFSMAVESLEALNIKNIKNNIIVVSNRTNVGHKLATFLIKKTPFSKTELDNIEKILKKLNFEFIYSPNKNMNNEFYQYINSKKRNKFYSDYKYNIKPVTDDNPFFFYLLKPNKFLNIFKLLPKHENYNFIAIFILVVTIVSVLVLVILFILLPVIFKLKNSNINSNVLKILIYFSCLGAGFMLIENSLIQRFILFLGHPVYALSVVLFGLLVSTGLGSYLTNFFKPGKEKKYLTIIVLVFICLALTYNYSLYQIFNKFIVLNIYMRIIFSILLLLPLGIMLGTFFPLGIKTISKTNTAIIPWMWSINGAFSILGSLLSYLIALNLGFSVTLNTAIIIYFTGFLFFLSFKTTQHKLQS